MNNSLGEMIRQIRMEKGLSQLQLAGLIHVDRSTIANWETGRRLPDADMIKILSNALDTDVSILINASVKQNSSLDVIMIDDEKIILTGSIPVLQKVLPYATVTGFTKPSGALDFARGNRVSLAFLDIEMGKVSGLDLCRDLLTINPYMNVIFLTAYAEYSFDAWDTGACGFLLKPISEEAVKRQLAKLRFSLRGGDGV